MRKKLVIGTRGSRLALWQAYHVEQLIKDKYPALEVEIRHITTIGDKILDVPLAKIGGKGLFTKELENAMLAGEIDIAVHSLKDMPTVLPAGLTLAAITKREDPADAFVSLHYQSLDELPVGAKIGTSSLRRKAQLLAYRPDLHIVDLRGNLDTRLKKMETEEMAGIVLAAAGLKRLGWQHLIRQQLPQAVCLPAVGQGALAIESRQDDALLAELDFLNDRATRQAATAERAYLREVEGGCQIPLGVHGTVDGDTLRVEAIILSPDGRKVIKDHASGQVDDAERIGVELAQAMLQAGGREILAALTGGQDAMKPGKVYLVGAGPGDYKLLSLKAMEAMQIADVLVYDRLADERLLSFAKDDVEKIYVGKASSQHTMKQGDINRLLVEKAKTGKTVVRLKGGDPFVFGRGGEEALELVADNIPFEIIPGITSAISVPAYAGIPVTHRGIATSFAVVTGHEDPTKPESTMRWEQLATATDTLVFLMGVENLPHITAKLIEFGRPAATPAAIIRWGTKPEQEVFITTVGQAAAEVAAKNIKPPAIFLVGEVVTLRDKLAWFDQSPLFGKQVLVTRAREQASVLTTGLEALGARCLEAPSIKIMPPNSYGPLDTAIAALASYQWLIFTSANGVKHFFARLAAAALDTRALAGIKVVAIGSQTAQALAQHGIKADVVPLEFRAEGIIEALRGRIAAGERVLIPRAAVARDILPVTLKDMGVDVQVVEAYQTIAADTDGHALAAKLAAGEIDIVTFTSSSTVTNLLQLIGSEAVTLLKRVKVACIGPITAATCEEHGITPAAVAEDYTIDGLITAVQALLKGE